MSTVDTRMSRVDRRLSFGQMGVHANISSIDIELLPVRGLPTNVLLQFVQHCRPQRKLVGLPAFRSLHQDDHPVRDAGPPQHGQPVDDVLLDSLPVVVSVHHVSPVGVEDRLSLQTPGVLTGVSPSSTPGLEVALNVDLSGVAAIASLPLHRLSTEAGHEAGAPRGRLLVHAHQVGVQGLRQVVRRLCGYGNVADSLAVPEPKV